MQKYSDIASLALQKIAKTTRLETAEAAAVSIYTAGGVGMLAQTCKLHI